MSLMTDTEASIASDIGLAEPDRQLPGWASPRGAATRPPEYRDFHGLLARFDPISLAEMDGVALLNRTDTKYVMSAHQLYSALAALPEHYWVLDIRGTRLSRYQTLYFDTEDFALYLHHHSGKRLRYKVRSREYVDTHQSFLELKWKAKRGRTMKDRVRTNHFVTRWVDDAEGLLTSRAPGEPVALEPKLCNEFYRATLVSNQYRERVTLDLGLQFQSDAASAALPGIAIVEVKQDGVNRDSAFVRQMRAAGLRPGAFSKYCMGVSMLYPDVKHNRFKPNLRLVGKLMGSDSDA